MEDCASIGMVKASTQSTRVDTNSYGMQMQLVGVSDIQVFPTGHERGRGRQQEAWLQGVQLRVTQGDGSVNHRLKSIWALRVHHPVIIGPPAQQGSKRGIMGMHARKEDSDDVTHMLLPASCMQAQTDQTYSACKFWN